MLKDDILIKAIKYKQLSIRELADKLGIKKSESEKYKWMINRYNLNVRHVSDKWYKDLINNKN